MPSKISQRTVCDKPLAEKDPLLDRRVALVGKLAGMTRREAKQRLRNAGAVPVDALDETVDLAIVGEQDLVLNDAPAMAELFDGVAREAADEGRLEVISETELWHRLGLIDTDEEVRRLYTPAMLAELLGVSVAVVRRWHRRGLITPVREVHKLPYFDYQEVTTARRLASLLAAGVSPRRLEEQLDRLGRWLPDAERSLAQLSVIVEGKHILLRQGDGLVDSGGQLRLDFDAGDENTSDEDPQALKVGDEVSTLSASSPEEDEDYIATPSELVEQAADYEERGDLKSAAELYRAALAAGGPRAEICFLLAEVLYRQGDIPGARERYYTAIELDEDLVEARNNLGCVLLETGETQLAVAAFEGALVHHQDYADAHYHLAEALDLLARTEEAAAHWKRFVELAPDSPWADKARTRLDTSSPTTL